MKKFFAVFFILAALTSVSTAQVQLGLQAGVNFADVSLDPIPEGVSVETSMKTGFLFGGVVFYSFSPILGLQLEPAYIQKGAKVDESYTEEGITFKTEGTLTADYIDVPLLLKASFGEGSVKPYLMAGASVAFQLGDVEIELDKATLNGEDVTNQIPSDLKKQKVESKSPDFLLNFGGGVLFPLGKVNIFIEGQYNLGLVDLNDEPDDDMEIKSKGIQVKAGVLFPIGN
jgi:hypothetical protein